MFAKVHNVWQRNYDLQKSILQDTLWIVATVRQTNIYKRWYSRLKDRRARARIDIRIRRLSLGNLGDVKPVGSGISELRINYGQGYRVYFMNVDSEVIILLAGGDKSSQQKDIETAKELASNL